MTKVWARSWVLLGALVAACSDDDDGASPLADAGSADGSVLTADGSVSKDAGLSMDSSVSIDAALDTGVPVGFGLLTCDDERQALARAGFRDSREDKGREAAEAALATALMLRRLP